MLCKISVCLIVVTLIATRGQPWQEAKLLTTGKNYKITPELLMCKTNKPLIPQSVGAKVVHIVRVILHDFNERRRFLPAPASDKIMKSLELNDIVLMEHN